MTSPLAKALSDYSSAWWAEPSLPKAISSPLGAWFLVAQLAGSPNGESLGASLGLPAEEARELADRLLANPHPALKAAAAVWARQGVLNREGEDFLAGLSPDVGQAEYPSQEEADAWASNKTNGMVPNFPLKVEDLHFVLASALAAEVSWIKPYSFADSADLGGAFGARIERCLTTWSASIFDTTAAGRVVAHWASSSTGVRVLSVIAAPDVSPHRVHDAALEILSEDAAEVSLADLELGDFEFWAIEEVEGFSDHSRAFLPAWTARVTGESIVQAPGVSDALDVMMSMLVEPEAGQAAQSAFAEYTAEGFKAAAVTAFGAPPTGLPQRKLVRSLTARFQHPYAVIAVTESSAPDPEKPWATTQVADLLWDGLPVFSAWVDTPMEAR